MPKPKACVVIPVYKKVSDHNEIISLKRGLEIFANYPVIFLCPQSFDESLLREFLNLHSQISFKKLSDQNFISTKSYSSMLISPEFYQSFAQYDFMMIYQPDAYVFSDQLEYWCNSGIDYIGAPWFEKFDETGLNQKFIPVAGNGGFSLRNISKINRLLATEISLSEKIKFLRLARETRFRPYNSLKFYINFFTKTKSFADICRYTINNSSCTNEDYFFAYIYPKMFAEFRSATAQEAIPFAFECAPEKLYEMNQNRLPFGCHAWQKYSPEFWKKFINS